MNVWVIVSVNILLIVGVTFAVYRFFRHRENKVLNAIQKMLDEAADGNFRVDRLDESKLSAVEHSMKHYLATCEVSSEHLTAQKKMVETMISDISHQSITPIANIALYAQLLEEQEGGTKEEILAIQDQVEKLDFLIQSLVKLSRLETGIISTAAKAEAFTKIWETMRSQFSLRAEQKGISFQIEKTEIRATFDLKWTIEAVANIVDNAIKYTPKGGSVSLRGELYPLFARIDVIDTGIGILEEEQSRIFSRFYRSPEASDEPGVGIGLFLAREIVRAQKGYIKVTSEKGKGSTVSVFLPV